MIKDFHNDFEVVKKLFDEPSSKIFIVRKNNSNEEYVCKRIEEKKFRKEEIELPNSLKSERVITIDYHYEKDGYNYLVMKKFDDIDVFEFFSDKFDISETMLKPFIKEMALCIRECHNKNIAHLDIKGENFIIKSRDPLKLTLIDFGGSCNIANRRTGLFGTILYCAPEILERNFSLSSDIWSLGAFIYYIMTNKDTFQHYKYDTHVIEDEKFSIELKDLLYKMLDYRPFLRPSIQEVLDSPWLKDS